MQKKKGISLIVLVITIIVMIILAATIILAINNNNVVDKAKDAVTETNLKQVQELAHVAWADAYIEGARTQEDLEKAVQEALKDVDKSKYVITVTTSGVTVTSNEKNEYGFYYDRLYEGTVTMNSVNHKVGMIFRSSKSVDVYSSGTMAFEVTGAGTEKLFYTDSLQATYAKNKVTLPDDEGTTVEWTFSEDGKSITVGTTLLTLSTQQIRGVDYNKYAKGTVNIDGATVEIKGKLINSTTMEFSIGTNKQTATVELKANGHLITGTTIADIYVSIDGKHLISNMDGVFVILTVDSTASSESTNLWYDGWEVAYAYIDGSWQTIIASEIEGLEDMTTSEVQEELGEVQTLARFYKTGETLPANGTLPTGDGYRLVISGNGAMPSLTSTGNMFGNSDEHYAWIRQWSAYAQSETEELPKICYTTEVVIEEGVTTIGEFALLYTTNCRTISVPSTLVEINAGSIFGCFGTINVASENPNYSSQDGILYNKTKTRIIFASPQITEVTIPKTVTEIDAGAFMDCDKLESVVVPANVTELKAETFWSCNNLTTATILSQTIKGEAFLSCGKLETVIISKNVTSINNGAFYFSDNIKNVYYEGTEAEWTALGVTDENLLAGTISYNYVIE